MNSILRNRRGILDDVFDYIFIVFIGLFMIFFLGNYLNGPLEHGTEISLHNIAQVHHTESAISNLRINVYVGFRLDSDHISEMIQNSRVLAGRVITSCTDYNSRVDCTSDTTGISLTGCVWDSSVSSCSIAFQEPTGVGRLPGGRSS